MKIKLRAKQLGIIMAIITMGIILSGCSNENSKKELVGEFRHMITANLDKK